MKELDRIGEVRVDGRGYDGWCVGGFAGGGVGSAWRARVRAVVPRWAETGLLIGPICFPMAVAWIGQMQYARTVMGWPLAGAVVFAAGFELSTVYVARLDWKARGEGDNSVAFRAATWMFAVLAATMNYWHAAEPGLRPNGEAVLG